MNSHRANPQHLDGNQETLGREIGYLATHWLQFTSQMQTHLTWPLTKLRHQQRCPSDCIPLLEGLLVLDAETESSKASSNNNVPLFDEQSLRTTENILTEYCRMLNIVYVFSYLKYHLLQQKPKPSAATATGLNSLANNNSINHIPSLSNLGPSLNNIGGAGTKGLPISREGKQFEPINALHPDYRHYSKMGNLYSKKMEDHGVLPQASKFHFPHRLFVRGEELKEQMEEGNNGIMLLTVEGTHIVGKRGLAVAVGSAIEWWTKRADTYEGYLGEAAVMETEEQKPQKSREDQQQQQNSNNPDGPQPGIEKNKADQRQKQKPKRKRLDSQLSLQYRFIGHSGPITALSLSVDELYIISAATDNIIKLWCLRTKMCLAQYKYHFKVIWSLDFCESGFFFLSSGGDHEIVLWETVNPSPRRIYQGHKGDVYKIKFMRNPDYIISCSSDKTVRIWTTQKPQCLRVIKFDREVINFCLSFSGRYLVTCENNGMMTLLDLLGGHDYNVFNLFFLRSKDQGSQIPLQRIKYHIHDMCFSPDQREFACISRKEIALYTVNAMKQKKDADMYDDKNLNNNAGGTRDFHLRPREVLDLKGELNLTYCKYHTADLLVVAGHKHN